MSLLRKSVEIYFQRWEALKVFLRKDFHGVICSVTLSIFVDFSRYFFCVRFRSTNETFFNEYFNYEYELVKRITNFAQKYERS